MNWEPRPTDNHYGPRINTVGIIVHSTRGGASSQEREYQATCAWFANPASQVSAHRVIGFDGNGAICVADDRIAWHAGPFYNPSYLGVELTQPTINDDYSAAQYDSLRQLLKWWCTKYNIPFDRNFIKGHDEISLVKSDPGHKFDWSRIFKEDEVAALSDEEKRAVREGLDEIWQVREGLRAAAEYLPDLIPLHWKMFDAVVKIKVATGLQ